MASFFVFANVLEALFSLLEHDKNITDALNCTWRTTILFLQNFDVIWTDTTGMDLFTKLDSHIPVLELW